jgi:hypothetical protein
VTDAVEATGLTRHQLAYRLRTGEAQYIYKETET